MQYVDFSAIPPQQQAMHDRLENWGRSCHGKPSIATTPMFRLFRSREGATPYTAPTRSPLDHDDARRIGLGVYQLPDTHRMAVQWYYVQRTSVMSARRALACTSDALARYVLDGRTMLINRGV